ncbi:MAG: thioredoxin-disulfide reductase [Candidatus Brocadiae bacterium]|nr:thioredoxin-disulfide reductase [Candidatus Brocadiia bacterium]
MQKVQVLILGSGCSGHTAAIYAARAGLNPVVLEGNEPGGQLSLTSVVENYPGFPEGINGFELIENMKQQAIRFGATYITEKAMDANLSSRPFTVITDAQSQFEAQTLIIATGARARLLGIPGEKENFGHGVSSCATCDGAFYRNKKVVVIGGGDTAMEDALFLTRFASEVYLMHRRDSLRASKIMQKRVMENPKIHIHWNTEIMEVLGENHKVTGLKIVYHPEGKPLERIDKAGSVEKSGVTVSLFPCDGLFLAIGHIPNTEFLKGQLPVNEEGYLMPQIQEDGCATCDVWSKVPGVFLAGDVVDWEFQQAITAAGMGCKAAMAAEAFLAEQEG